ncbi:MAG: SMC-Scp complex subunit ScpB [Clostridia bacterium]|nr:SMC-Scp complex subunit ScpB [Clostridia bacterium]
MELEKAEAIIEAMLFSTGSIITIKDIMNIVELGAEDIEKIMQKMRTKYEAENSGIELVRIEDGYQLCTKKEYYEYIIPLFDNRSKPSISNAALETLSIIAYNPKITRSEIDAIRGVNSDGTIYKLLEYNLIEEAGKLDAPGKPVIYRVTPEFMKMFGISSLDDLPELPRYKIDENEQIVIDDIMLEEKQEKDDSMTEENEIKA